MGWILIAEGAGIVGSIFTTPEIAGWYTTLVKPELNPPSWVFGPVWTTLFLLMGVAAFLVARAGWDRLDVKKALGVFVLQLVLNSMWSLAFFGLHSPALALGVIIILWIAILTTIIAFSRVSKTASYLLYPYILWVSFAAYLNLAIVLLN